MLLRRSGQREAASHAYGRLDAMTQTAAACYQRIGSQVALLNPNADKDHVRVVLDTNAITWAMRAHGVKRRHEPLAWDRITLMHDIHYMGADADERLCVEHVLDATGPHADVECWKCRLWLGLDAEAE